MKLFSEKHPFYRANFHCHTTNSDGGLSPEDCVRFYNDAGYDVLSITDHRSVTHLDETPDHILVIPGIELDYVLPEELGGQWVHILGIGMENRVENEWKRTGQVQEGIDLISRLGGVSVFAHPAWSLNTPAFMSSLTGLSGVEIWNSVSTLPYNADRADSSSLLDTTWSYGGELLPVMANDDSHAYGEEAGVAATMVQAAHCTKDEILDSLRKGNYYATLGPKIYQIEKNGTEIRVNCSPAEAVVFYSNMPWADHRVQIGHNITEAVYHIESEERFVRVEIRDEREKRAWSRPISVEE